MQGSFMNVIVF